jgi:hypothetical protein
MQPMGTAGHDDNHYNKKPGVASYKRSSFSAEFASNGKLSQPDLPFSRSAPCTQLTEGGHGNVDCTCMLDALFKRNGLTTVEMAEQVRELMVGVRALSWPGHVHFDCWVMGGFEGDNTVDVCVFICLQMYIKLQMSVQLFGVLKCD